MRDANDVFEYASLPEVAENVSWDYHRNISDSKFFRIITHQYEDCTQPWELFIKKIPS
jgi:hypothetical protein